MYKKIVCFIGVFILCTSISFANTKDNIKDIDLMSNCLNTLFLSIIKGDSYEQTEKDIKFIEAQVIRERKEILTALKNTKGNEKSDYLALLSILNYYEISTIKVRDFYENNNSQSLILAVSTYNEGNSILDILKSKA